MTPPSAGRGPRPTGAPGPVLVEVVRSGVVESVHTGHLVLLGPDGAVTGSWGGPDRPVFWRSSAKPLQASALLRAGVTLTSEQLALATASHSGEPRHVEVATSTLAAAGLTEDDLGCPPDWPLDEDARALVRADAPGPRQVWMNCSGKHAAMLATCRHRQWPTATYLDPTHPLQRHVRGTVEDLAGETVAATGVDGCGLPLFALSLLGLARAFARLVDGPVADAARAHPFLVAGTGRLTTRLLADVPGVLVKEGAEGVYAAALPSGAAVAVKVDDGALRAAEVLVLEGLRRLDPSVPWPSVPPVLGGGRAVGELRPVLS